VHFAPIAVLERGNPRVTLQVGTDSLGARTSEIFSVAFTNGTQYTLRNLTRGTVITSPGTFASGVPILFEGVRLTITTASALTEDLPKEGDSVVVRPGIQAEATGLQTVLSLQPFDYDVSFATSNGVVMTFRLADTLATSKITYRDQFEFNTLPAEVASGTTTSDLDRVKVVPNPYLVSSRYEEEFGILRKEPIRQLRFNNLPARCTIYIFSIAGDKIQTIVHNSDNGTEAWDMRTSGNREIAPGVYLFLVKTDTAQKLGRFAVVK
jgi:hypothetical protein